MWDSLALGRCNRAPPVLTGTHVRVLSDWGLKSSLVSLVPNLGDALGVVREKRHTSISFSSQLVFSRKVDVTFVDKNDPSDFGFSVTLSTRMSYPQMAVAVAKHLKVDSAYLQFFEAQIYRDGPGPALQCTFDGTLKDFLVFCRPKVPKRMYYQQLPFTTYELETIRRQVKCNLLLPEQGIDTEVTLYPHKYGTVSDLLYEAKTNCLQLPNGTRCLRLLEIQSHKISRICKLDEKINTMAGGPTWSHRIEKIPADQLQVNNDEILVPVVHFHQDPSSAFGHPFLLKVKDGEPFYLVKERIKSRLVRAPHKLTESRTRICP